MLRVGFRSLITIGNVLPAALSRCNNALDTMKLQIALAVILAVNLCAEGSLPSLKQRLNKDAIKKEKVFLHKVVNSTR